MRFFEFAGDEGEGIGIDRFIMVLRNYIGRASSRKAPARLNWMGLNRIAKMSGFELAADYPTFKAMFDNNPAIQDLVKDFNQDGIELNVPGAPDAQQEPTQGGQTSQDAVDQAAASAAPAQLAQTQATPKATQA